MLSHLSSKFDIGPQDQTHEPRAALFLNRFTRTLTIMYATSGIEQIIGIPSEEMIGRSFYFCIGEECMRDAVDVLERAKGNDSIAYLRFFFRDPRQDDPPAREPSESLYSESEDDVMTDVTSDDDTESNVDGDGFHGDGSSTASHTSSVNGTSRHSHSTNGAALSTGGVSLLTEMDSSGSLRPSNGASVPPSVSSSTAAHRDPIELEAVVSCTSDGLVVCLRRARPMIPGARLPNEQVPEYNGVFAAPWAHQPMFLPPLPQQPSYPLGAHHPSMAQAGPVAPIQNAFMDSIRDVAVFAWALVGINGSLTEYSKGTPTGQSQPPDGFPVWDPAPRDKMSATPSGYHSGSSSSNDPYGFGDPGR